MAERRASLRTRPHGYGMLLVLILLSVGFQLAAPDRGWARLVATGLQAGTLVLALWASQSRRWELRAGIAVAIVGVVGATVALIVPSDLGRPLARAATLVLVALTPPVIAFGVIRSLRDDREVTLRTMFGVLCIYLLVGMFFGFCFGLVDDLSSRPFFAQVAHASPSDFLYFSFTTMTTVGYGDLTAQTNFGRSVAITQALIGQIYLVTVVSLIIGNMGRSRAGPRRTR